MVQVVQVHSIIFIVIFKKNCIESRVKRALLNNDWSANVRAKMCWRCASVNALSASVVDWYGFFQRQPPMLMFSEDVGRRLVCMKWILCCRFYTTVKYRKTRIQAAKRLECMFLKKIYISEN